MTTDAEEGRRQIEAMKPEPLKVGDKVRLKAGGERVMTVIGTADYQNLVECVWSEPATDPALLRKGASTEAKRDVFPVRSLMRVEAEK